MTNDIKIFVSHRIDMNCDAIDNPLMIPVRCGAVYDDRKDSDIIGDDTGDNISERRLSFCEMTVQYWAWKNVKADYYGLFHYRRYFNFSPHHFIEDQYGNVIDQYIDEDSVQIYDLYEDAMRKLIMKYDLIIPEKKDVSQFPEKYTSLWDHWNKSKDLHKKDLETMNQIVIQMYPNMRGFVKRYLNGTKAYFCSMHIMKASLFKQYCEWIFPILFELEKEIDISFYSEEGQRTVAHLAERLLGIYIEYIKEMQPNIRIKELQTVLFLKPQKRLTVLPPAFPERMKVTIPIVFAANSVFLPICSVAIQSIIENANSQKYYDIVIIESDISDYDKKILLTWISKHHNFSIRFFNAHAITDQYHLVANEHITVETYYRFLVQSILPDYDKVLYLDGDLVCNQDVSILYEIDVKGAMLAAAHDPDVNGQLNLPNSDTYRYLSRELKMKNPYDYFQAGVLLLNTREMRKAYSLEQWLTFASRRYHYNDQDVLNRYCQGRVKYIPMNWNMLIDCNNYRVPVVIKSAAGNVCKEYILARKEPYIIHFAGFQKPWKQRGVDLEWEFWKYARNTPYYEQLFLSLIGYVKPPENSLPPIGVKGTIKIYIRKKVDKIFPRGTRRRQILMRLFRR